MLLREFMEERELELVGLLLTVRTAGSLYGVTMDPKYVRIKDQALEKYDKLTQEA